MIKNFITITVRSFLRQRLYSVINVAGLASGLLCVMFIYLWVTDELKKDGFHHEGEKIFRVMSNLTLEDGEVLTWFVTPGPLAEDTKENFPEIEDLARLAPNTQTLLEFEGNKFVEKGYYADPSFFNIFSFPILEGKPFNGNEISSIALSDKTAARIFGSNAQAMGKTILVNQQPYTVGCIYEHPGPESSMDFNWVLNFEIYKKNRGEGFNWGNYDHPLFVKVAPEKAASLMTGINKRAKVRADGKERFVKYYLQPFEDAYLNGRFENGVPAGGRIEYIRIFVVVGIFMLIIACINFTNMATARAAFRAKEVGIRKVIGAYRRSIIYQFILESILVSLLSMIFAIGFVYLLLPAFNTLVSKSIVLDLSDPTFLLTIAGVVIVTGVLAGSYPALFLSSYEPATVLKGSMSKSFSGASLRKLLVVFQFCLTVILIASSLVIYSQIDFIRNKNLGYNRESVLWFPAVGEINSKFDAFQNELSQLPGVVTFGRANESLVQVNNQNSSVTWPGKDENNNPFFRTVLADYGYVETMGLQLSEGRFFSRENNDTSNFILTRRAIEVMGLENPIGTTISQWGFSGKVIGVVEDLHTRSLQESIDPVVFFCKPEWTGMVFVRIEATQTEDALAAIQGLFRKYTQDFPFEYHFLDNDFEKLYDTEKITGVLALGFTTMAIIISGLGLLGLASYTAEKRKKEISIRKTLGASVTGIVTMISKDFVKLCGIAAVIGSPVAYYLMDEFLSGYAFHTELDWKVFVLTAVAITAICVLTVVFQVVRAAIANPVDALRNE